MGGGVWEDADDADPAPLLWRSWRLDLLVEWLGRVGVPDLAPVHLKDSACHDNSINVVCLR